MPKTIDKKVKITEKEYVNEIFSRINASKKGNSKLSGAYFKQKELRERNIELDYYKAGGKIFFEIHSEYITN